MQNAFVEAADLCKECVFIISAGIFSLAACGLAALRCIICRLYLLSDGFVLRIYAEI